MTQTKHDERDSIIFDSSIWIGLFLDFDTNHRKAARLMQEITGIIRVPYCVVSETATVIAYKHSKEQADNFLLYIVDSEKILLLDDVVRDEAEFYRSLPYRISFTDASLLLLAKKYKTRLITFDKQLERIARKLLP